MKLIFVHGWSVTSTETYGKLPEVLQREGAKRGLEIEIANIYLGEYISFHDEVHLEDIARAFDKARKDKIGEEKFACITHSTGGPAMRLWIDLFFKADLSLCPLSHLVMLAPANHGSSLAILGKKRLGRIKAWWNGIEPGVGVLNWLQLGSKGQWMLNSSWIDYRFGEHAFFPFVLSGEFIDHHFYDFINPYLVEKGSDGVIRLCGANLNYRKVTLIQDVRAGSFRGSLDGSNITVYPLELKRRIRKAKPCAFEIIPEASHSGERYGIMNSIKKDQEPKPVISSVLKALQVKSDTEYAEAMESMQQNSEKLQEGSDRYFMLVFNVRDNYGNKIDDYDMLLLAGENYEPGSLPTGFFVDRQKNDASGNLSYYLNYDKMKEIAEGKLGIRIVARPDAGFSRYAPAEFRSSNHELEHFIRPNETIMVDVVLTRLIAENTFVLDKVEDAPRDFRGREADNEFLG